MTKQNPELKYDPIPEGLLEIIWEEINQINYDFPYIFRNSLNQKNLYIVIAKKKDSVVPCYSFWKCYDGENPKLDCGHYGYENFEDCFSDAVELIN